MSLRLPKPAAPLAGLPAPSQSDAPARPKRIGARPPSPNGKQRDLTLCATDQLSAMLDRVTELLRSTTLASLAPSANEKLTAHREALELELKHRENDERLERARLDGATSTTPRTSPAQAMRTRLLAQPALDAGRMRGISMEATMVLESNAAARRRMVAESTDFNGRMRELRIGSHAQPRFENDAHGFAADDSDGELDLADEPPDGGGDGADEYEGARGFGFARSWADGYAAADYDAPPR